MIDGISGGGRYGRREAGLRYRGEGEEGGVSDCGYV